MPVIKFVEANGAEHEVDIPVGKTIMQGAVDNMLPGIIAECGGSCSCGTCHVYVDAEWLAKSGEVDDLEQDMLQIMGGVESNSRLSCQVQITAEMQGMVVHLPESQY